jgi:AraC family transcriptional regulator of adaptative response/methylated-DNA-[protein]-cysteine methyltransferase
MDKTMKEKDISIICLNEDYQRVEKAIQYLGSNFRQQPSLSELARHVHLSEYHFQRMFTRWAGVSPKRYLQYLTKEYARDCLQSSSIMETSYQLGLSGAGRLHDLFVSWEAVSPGEYRASGEGLRIGYTVQPSPFGECFLAATERGICYLAFPEDDRMDKALEQLQKRFRLAEFVRDDERVGAKVAQVFSPYMGLKSEPVHIWAIGSGFQIKVWEALLRIPTGKVVAYHDVAVMIGAPRADRAVGHAIGLNPLPILIPCHRVIRHSGELGKYRYVCLRASDAGEINPSDRLAGI